MPRSDRRESTIVVWHTIIHPVLMAGPICNCEMMFPRPQVYRVWVPFQRKGMINTAGLNVPFSEMPTAKGSKDNSAASPEADCGLHPQPQNGKGPAIFSQLSAAWQ